MTFIQRSNSLEQQLRQLLNDSSIACSAYEFSLAQYHDGLFHELAVASPAGLARWVTKRKAEYLAGRFAAQQCLQQLQLRPTAIGTGAHREPLWPDGVIGSISHSADTALAILTRAQERLIGIDTEHLLSREQSRQTMPVFLDADEQKLIASAPERLAQWLPTAIFSAKESFFKAVFRHVQHYFDFDAIRCVSASDAHLKFRLDMPLPALSPRLRPGDRFDVAFFTKSGEANSVTTLIML